MTVSRSVRFTLGVCAVVAVAGCSGGASTSGYFSTPRAHTSQGWLSYQAITGERLLFVADQPTQSVYIFPQQGKNPAPIGAITQGINSPTGLFVDRHGTLYVCNSGAANVTVYPKGSLSPSKTLTGAGVTTLDVVVGKDGTVYVSDFNEGYDGHVFEYANGSTTPTTTITLKGYPAGLALDNSNNLYVAYQKTNNAGTVLKFKPGSIRGHDLVLPIVLVGGATVDSRGDLLVADQSNPNPHVDVFPPGAKIPSQTIGGFPLVLDIALNHDNTHLYVTQNQNPAIVYEVSYPGGTILKQITKSLTAIYGVATSPDGSP
jgi:serine/threonine-protein kinase